MDENYLGNTVTEIPAFHKNVLKKMNYNVNQGVLTSSGRIRNTNF